MTHDELLQKINRIGSDDALYRAFYAVVELHKPKTSGFPGYPEYTATICSVCGILKTYPCLTIQTIEREL